MLNNFVSEGTPKSWNKFKVEICPELTCNRWFVTSKCLSIENAVVLLVQQFRNGHDFDLHNITYILILNKLNLKHRDFEISLQ